MRSSYGIAMLMFFSSQTLIFSDSIVVDGTIYDRVLVTESTSMYYVQVPESGSSFCVPKKDDSNVSIRITDDAERTNLREEYKKNREKVREQAVGNDSEKQLPDEVVRPPQDTEAVTHRSREAHGQFQRSNERQAERPTLVLKGYAYKDPHREAYIVQVTEEKRARQAQLAAEERARQERLKAEEQERERQWWAEQQRMNHERELAILSAPNISVSVEASAAAASSSSSSAWSR